VNKDLRSKELRAAEIALHRGWWVFGTCPASKKPFKGTHGSKDARNDDTALLRWDTDPEANPCVRRDKSGLTVLDADHGLTSLEHAEAWAAANNIPSTYIVQSGREGGGFHFYFKGVRKLPDVVRNPSAGRVGFELDGVSGDIKCHGHVVLAGGLHKTGTTYRGNGREKFIAPLPDLIRDYRDPKDVRQSEAYKVRVAKWAAVYPEPTEPTQYLWKKNDGRHNQLLSDAGRLRQLGLEEDAIYLGLKNIAARWFEDGVNYDDAEIRRLAHDIGAKPCHRILLPPQKKTGLIIRTEPTPRGLVAQFLRQEFPVGSLPISIHAIVERIAMDYPAVPIRTCRRAMADVNFVIAGKDPVDSRIQLWARKGTKKRTGTPSQGTP
jgi:hypothetical protein